MRFLVLVLFIWVVASSCHAPPTSAGGAPDREHAINALLREVIQPAALDHRVVATGMDRPLSPGQQVTTENGADGPEVVFSTTASAWFFLVDDDPLALWSHPVRYVLIDADTNAVTVSPRGWRPFVDGVPVLPDTLKGALGGPGVVYRNFALSAAPPVRSMSVLGLPQLPPPGPSADCPNGHIPHRYAILVAGGDRNNHTFDEAMRNDIAQLNSHLPQFGFAQGPTAGGTSTDDAGNATTVLLYGKDSPNVGQAFADRLSALAGIMECCDELFIFYDGHGFEPKKNADGTTGYALAMGQNKVTTDDVTKRLNALKSCHVYLVVDACYSGGFIDMVTKGSSKVERASSSSSETSPRHVHLKLDKDGNLDPEINGSGYPQTFIEGLDSSLTEGHPTSMLGLLTDGVARADALDPDAKKDGATTRSRNGAGACPKPVSACTQSFSLDLPLMSSPTQSCGTMKTQGQYGVTPGDSGKDTVDVVLEAPLAATNSGAFVGLLTSDGHKIYIGGAGDRYPAFELDEHGQKICDFPATGSRAMAGGDTKWTISVTVPAASLSNVRSAAIDVTNGNCAGTVDIDLPHSQSCPW